MPLTPSLSHPTGFSAPNWILLPHGMVGWPPQVPKLGRPQLTNRGHTWLNLPHGTPCDPPCLLSCCCVLVLPPTPHSQPWVFSLPLLLQCIVPVPCSGSYKTTPSLPARCQGQVVAHETTGSWLSLLLGSEGNWHWASESP